MYTYEIKSSDSRFIVEWHSVEPWTEYEKGFDTIEEARNFVGTEIIPDRALRYDGCAEFEGYDRKGIPVYGSTSIWSQRSSRR